MKKFMEIVKAPYIVMKEDEALFKEMPPVLRVVSVIATAGYTFMIVKFVKAAVLAFINI